MPDVPTLIAAGPEVSRDGGPESPRTRTHERAAFDALQRVEELTDALAARDGFIAAIGAELRNSLAPLVLLAEQFEALAHAATTPTLRSRTALLTRYLRSFTTTIDRVTEVTHLREGKLQLQLARVDLAEVVQEVCGHFHRQAIAGCVELVVQAPSAVHGRWDRGRLKQIVSNLVSNAIRYGGPGAVDLAIVERGHVVELTVRDHGEGLASADLPGIFDRFDHRMSQQVGGFGIGLFVVKTLSQAMGGEVSAENAEGGGARFTVRLPRG